MGPKHDTTSAVVASWLADFEQALRASRDAGLRALFRLDCHWRDVLALTWTIQTLGGRDAVVSALKQWTARARPKGFRIAENRTPPRRVTRVGTETIEALLAFETDSGWCNGVVRLIEGGSAPTAWTLLTALDQIKGHEEQFGPGLRRAAHCLGVCDPEHHRVGVSPTIPTERPAC